MRIESTRPIRLFAGIPDSNILLPEIESHYVYGELPCKTSSIDIHTIEILNELFSLEIDRGYDNYFGLIAYAEKYGLVGTAYFLAAHKEFDMSNGFIYFDLYINGKYSKLYLPNNERGVISLIDMIESINKIDSKFISLGDTIYGIVKSRILPYVKPKMREKFLDTVKESMVFSMKYRIMVMSTITKILNAEFYIDPDSKFLKDQIIYVLEFIDRNKIRFTGWVDMMKPETVVY